MVKLDLRLELGSGLCCVGVWRSWDWEKLELERVGFRIGAMDVVWFGVGAAKEWGWHWTGLELTTLAPTQFGRISAGAGTGAWKI